MSDPLDRSWKVMQELEDQLREAHPDLSEEELMQEVDAGWENAQALALWEAEVEARHPDWKESLHD